MSEINSTITISTAEYRPCYVNGQKAMFHRWVEKRTVVAPSPLKGGHAGGEFAGTYALVEMDDGSIKIAYPNEVRFADNKLNEYAFNSSGSDIEHDVTKLRTDNALLKNHIKSLEERLKHLLQSDIIRLYDRIDPRTRDYIHDVTTLDDYFESLKQQSRELKITRAFIHDKNLEYDLLVYSKNKEQ